MNMVRRPWSARAQRHRGGSTSAADPTRTQAVRSDVAAPGGTAVRAALRSSGQFDDTLPERRRRGGVELVNNMKSTEKGATTTTGARAGRQGSRQYEKKFVKCTSCGGRRPKYVKTGYGNWIKWSPPKPLNNVKTKCDSAEKRKKALKTEKAMVQLKKQVKALTAKNAELQARLRLQEDTGAGVKKEEPPATMKVRLAQITNPEQAATVTPGKPKLQDVHEYHKEKSDAMERKIKKLEKDLEEVMETCTEELEAKWKLARQVKELQAAAEKQRAEKADTELSLAKALSEVTVLHKQLESATKLTNDEAQIIARRCKSTVAELYRQMGW